MIPKDTDDRLCDNLTILAGLTRYSEIIVHNRNIPSMNNNDKLRILVAETRGIESLVKLLRDRDVDMRKCAADVLRSLAVNAENQVFLARAGAIEPLVHLLRDPNTDVRKHAAGALWNLAVNLENQVLVARAGAVEPLVRLLQDSNIEVKKHAASTLWNLAVNAENQVAITRAGAIEPLVRLLRNPDTELRENAAGTLWNLAANTENQMLIARAGAIDLLVRLLWDSNTDVGKRAASALRNLTANAENKVLVAKAGAIKPLVQLLQNPDPEMRENAAGTLWNLTANTKNQALIVKAGAIKPLVQLFQDSNAYVKTSAAGTLWNLTKNHSTHQQQLVDVGGVSLLKQSITTETDSAIKQKAEKILRFCQHLTPSALSTKTMNTNSTRSDASTESGVSYTLIPRHKVSIGGKLEQSGFGQVYEGTYKLEKVAVKSYSGGTLTPKVKQEVEHEITMMQRLNHECLVHLLGVMQVPNEPPILVIEYGAQGSLFAYLQSHQTIPWGLRLRMAEELARGLAYLHEERVFHRDIKSLNVVLDRDFHAKWCNFGLACLKLPTQSTFKASAQETTGTLRWMAPELLADDVPVFSMASDIWAIGMVYFELTSRLLPYQNLSDAQVMFKISQGKAETVPKACQYQSPLFAQLIADCWQERTQRPSAAELARRLTSINQTFEERSPPI